MKITSCMDGRDMGTCLAGQCPNSSLFVQKPVTDCLCASLCQWWERRRDVLPSFTKAYNLLMLPYHWLLQSHLPRMPSRYVPQLRQAVKMLAGILTLKWLGKTAGIRLTDLFGGFTLFVIFFFLKIVLRITWAFKAAMVIMGWLKRMMDEGWFAGVPNIVLKDGGCL